MALTDKNIVIVPSIGASTGTNPRILFTGGDVTSSATITLSVYNSGTQGTLSFSGNSGQLFSIVDTMSGSIFSVNDISGIPSIEVLDTGLIKLAQYNGNVAISTSTAVSGYKLSVFGGTSLNGNNQITGITTVTNTTQATSTSTGALQIAGGVGIAGNLWVGGTINATIQGTISTASSVNTVAQTGNAAYYPTFVDTNNASSTPELLYTTSSFAINPQSGNVGIATVSPTAKLTVNGTAKVGEGVATNTSKFMVNTQAGTAAGIQLFQDSNESWIIQNPASSTALTFSASGSERVRIESAGFVGIGTSSPGFRLDVVGNGDNTARVGTISSSTAVAALQIATGNGTSIANNVGAIGVIAGESIMRFMVAANAGASFTNFNNFTKMVITNAGRVGIGIVTATSLLHVAGDALITGVTTVTNTTAATSTVTGALQVVGGVGIGGNLYVGGEIVAQKLTIQLTTVTTTLIETDDIIKTTNVTQATATATGALQVAGGASVGGNLWVGGTIIGNIAATVNTATNANNVATVLQTANAAYYPAFVDSNNATSAYELLYTTSSFSINPQTGFIGIGTSTPSSLYAVDVVSTSNAIIRAFGTSIGRLSLQNSTRHYSLSVQGGTLFFFDETSGLTRAAITSAGNVGIGTSTPSGILDVRSSSTNAVEAFILNSAPYGVGNTASSVLNLGKVESGTVQVMGAIYAAPTTVSNSTEGFLSFYTRTASTITERIRITNLGNVGIGTASPTSTLDIFGTAINSGTNSALLSSAGTLRINNFNSSTAVASQYGASLLFSQRWFTGSASPTDVVSVGQITGVKTRGDGNFGGGLAFWTNGLGSNALTERMRIDDTGYVLFNRTSRSTNVPDARVETDGRYGSVNPGVAGYLFGTTGTAFVISDYSSGTGEIERLRITNAGRVGIGIVTATSLLHVAGDATITGITTVTNTTAATSTVTGALQVVGGVGIQGDLYARNIFSNGSQVVTAASLGTYGVSTLSAGTGTAVSSNTGTVTVWVTATLANITANGSTTTATITAGNIFDPYIVDSITQQFDGYTAVFDLRVDQQYINSIVDSKDAEVILNGEQLYPYVDELRWPWHTPYDSYKGFRIVNGITTSSSVQLIIYNAPYIGDSASVTIRTRSTTRKKRKYPFSPATIALGD